MQNPNSDEKKVNAPKFSSGQTRNFESDAFLKSLYDAKVTPVLTPKLSRNLEEHFPSKSDGDDIDPEFSKHSETVSEMSSEKHQRRTKRGNLLSAALEKPRRKEITNCAHKD